MMTVASMHRLAGRTAATLLAVTAAAGGARAQGACQGDPSSARLHIVVEGVRSDAGVMTATLYGDDPARFLKGSGELQVWRAPAQSPTTEMCVFVPGPGTYALAVYHDAKRAYRFVQGAFGMPTQDFGVSGNPHMFLGPPSFNASKFTAAEGDTTITIKLRSP